MNEQITLTDRLKTSAVAAFEGIPGTVYDTKLIKHQLVGEKPCTDYIDKPIRWYERPSGIAIPSTQMEHQFFDLEFTLSVALYGYTQKFDMTKSYTTRLRSHDRHKLYRSELDELELLIENFPSHRLSIKVRVPWDKVFSGSKLNPEEIKLPVDLPYLLYESLLRK